MAYSEAAKERRRCTATKSDGTPCRGYAAWGDPRQRCGGHGGRRRGPTPVCGCAAYNWPHRPGGGLCRWPDAPIWRLTTPAGTHGPDRNRRQRYPWLDRLGDRWR